MRPYFLAATLTMFAASAMAQTLPGVDPQTGARPGNIIGTGMSEPHSTKASNIGGTDTRSHIAPNLPAPAVGPDATSLHYLQAAQAALAANKTGEAQEAMERAETRLLDRSVALTSTNNVSQNPDVMTIEQARTALGNGDTARATQIITQLIARMGAMH